MRTTAWALIKRWSFHSVFMAIHGNFHTNGTPPNRVIAALLLRPRLNLTQPTLSTITKPAPSPVGVSEQIRFNRKR
jgi:hypothetical protein